MGDIEYLLQQARELRPTLGGFDGDTVHHSDLLPDHAAPRSWFESEHDRVIGALRDAETDEPTEAVADLISHLWLLLPGNADAGLCRTIHDAAVLLAGNLPSSPALAVAFRRGATFFHARKDYRLAVAQGRHELAVHRARDDRESSAAALLSLAVTYRAQGRMHRVIDCADEILEDQVARGDQMGVAVMLEHLGRLMVEVGRQRTAKTYLERAMVLGEKHSDAALVARCHVHQARIQWSTGDENSARRRLRLALGQWIDLDPHAAVHVRTLLRTPRGASLPDPLWPEFGHPGCDPA